jgi:hypothetical protein
MQDYTTNTAEAPAVEAYAITPNDTTDITYVSRSLYIGGSGDVVVDMYGPVSGNRTVTNTPVLVTVTFKNVPEGSILPICVKRVRATGTTATNIVSLL